MVMQVVSGGCPCGSGLSHIRCCGVDSRLLAEAEAHRHLLPIEDGAVQAHRAGDSDAASRLALDVLELAPGRVAALGVLYELRRAQGVQAAAEALIRRIVAVQPNNFWAVNEMALLLLSKGALAEAEQQARNAVRIAPEAAQSHNLLGMVLTEAHRPAVAEYHYGRALALAGTRDATVLANFALCLKNQGKMRQARAMYSESLASAPDVVHTLLGLARLEEADRNLDAASLLLDRAEAADPGNPSVALARAVVLGRLRDEPAALAVLDGMAERQTQLGAAELLERGRLLDKVGRYGEAFASYADGKRRLREATGNAYRADHAQQMAARLAGFFTAQRLRTLPTAPTRTDCAQPLFVLGFPRSGTTLLEQTLTAHPRIAAGDELPIIGEIAALMPRMLDSPLGYPEALAELWMGDHRDDLANLRDHYFRRVSQLGIVPEARVGIVPEARGSLVPEARGSLVPEARGSLVPEARGSIVPEARVGIVPEAGSKARLEAQTPLPEGIAWFTDKMPLNETDLGLIALLFPQSPLIHMIRHPLDVVLSVFSNLLTHGHYCGYALESAAQHYVLTMDLVDHYRREMNLRYMAVRYEDVVQDQEGSIRRVLSFIGEAFDARCLAFHENRRYARTASYAQVSETLYSRSLCRYRNYLPQLQPAVKILRPVIERLGYTV